MHVNKYTTVKVQCENECTNASSSKDLVVLIGSKLVGVVDGLRHGPTHYDQ